ncbi:hypothetical protein L1887_10304 [Cichorium endivia]|nr:hypothetical protein L1887_10304 [Cichorium endivia]
MASSSSKSAQAGVSDYHHHDPAEITTVKEEETSDSEGVFANVQQPYVPKRRWSLLEDAKLLMHFAVHGAKMWRKISELLPGRSSDACRVRWANYFSPGKEDSPFNKEEELHLMAAHARYLNKSTGKNGDSIKNHFHALMAKKRRGAKLIPSAAKAAVSPPTAIFTDSTVVYPATSSSLSCTTAAGSGRDLSRNSTFKCVACTFNWNSDEHGQRTFMADCGICRRVLKMDGHMTSTGNVDQSSSSVFASVSLNLSLATTVYSPQPPPPTPSSPPPPPTFFDFLGVGSV